MLDRGDASVLEEGDEHEQAAGGEAMLDLGDEAAEEEHAVDDDVEWAFGEGIDGEIEGAGIDGEALGAGAVGDVSGGDGGGVDGGDGKTFTLLAGMQSRAVGTGEPEGVAAEAGGDVEGAAGGGEVGCVLEQEGVGVAGVVAGLEGLGVAVVPEGGHGERVSGGFRSGGAVRFGSAIPPAPLRLRSG